MTLSASGARTGRFCRVRDLAFVLCALLGPSAAYTAAPLHDACDLAASPHADALVNVPFDPVDGRIYVEAQVDGGRTRLHGPLRIGALSPSDIEVRVSARFPEVLIGAHALQQSVVLIDQRSQQAAVCAPTTGNP